MQNSRNLFSFLESIRLKEKAIDARQYVRTTFDCTKTIIATAKPCTSKLDGTGPFVDLRNINDKPIFSSKTDDSSKLGVDLRASCKTDDLIANFKIEWKKGGKSTAWQDLFSGIPIGCLQGELVNTVDGPGMALQCSALQSVPGTSNPFFAGSAAGTILNYPFSKGRLWDRSPDQNPTLVTPTLYASCITPGKNLIFAVNGTVSHGGGTPSSGADGGALQSHVIGPVLGKSNLVAPANSLVAVFLGPGSIDSLAPPPDLDFSTGSARDYATLSPVIGQIFFVGDGKIPSGLLQKVVVPAGATRLFIGTMDSGQWNNNAGAYAVAMYQVLSN